MLARELKTENDVDAIEQQLRANGKLGFGDREDAQNERVIRRIEDVPSVFAFANQVREFIIESFIRPPASRC